ncbi:PIN domain protein [Lentisphaera araneosa HTCC2155]|jgi:predicted nucleic acid-binding protein|uniref:PIN domain protein n=1 Tax=Lentisphaera araneosa HTCC2155 TaxID=313628 RepID=A6DU67_9BACT|nr:type II toxin-antitoxin system VapC family toxin [Lentisphaera araneosa]EDM24826.1 PIN domain protein [Lentisphaera araneosa HTCC2155]
MSHKKYLVDTCIIIDFLRGKEGAKEFISNELENICISVVTVAELYAGVKGKSEETQLGSFLGLFSMIELNKDISISSGYLKNKYYKSHNAGLADCMIAATALEYDFNLVTNNFKHFPMVEDKIKIL